MADIKKTKTSAEVAPASVETTSTPTQSITRRRVGPRVFLEDQGPLGHVMQWSIPGFHLYLAPENDPRSPNQIGYLTSDAVCYEFVHPLEVNACGLDGIPMEGDRIRVPLGNGLTGILLKLPEEYWQEDLAARTKQNELNAMQRIDADGKKSEMRGVTSSSSLDLKTIK